VLQAAIASGQQVHAAAASSERFRPASDGNGFAILDKPAAA
jgi:hypothetical protein